MKKILIVLALLAAAYVAFKPAKNTGDFNLSSVTFDEPYHAEWEAKPITYAEKSQVKSLLSKPWTYLGRGTQSIVFAQDDYVLKLFKNSHVNKWFGKNYVAFEGYKLAFEQNRDLSGLVFIHLNKTHDLMISMTLVDKKGKTHRIAADDLVFVIQKKAQIARNVFEKDLIEGNVDAVRSGITAILDLYMTEYSRNLVDQDHGVMHNIGFAEGKPIHLDVGRLTKDENVDPSQDLPHKVKKIQTWLDKQPVQYDDMIVFPPKNEIVR